MVHKVPENFNISDFDVFHSALVRISLQARLLCVGQSKSSDEGQLTVSSRPFFQSFTIIDSLIFFHNQITVLFASLGLFSIYIFKDLVIFLFIIGYKHQIQKRRTSDSKGALDEIYRQHRNS